MSRANSDCVESLDSLCPMCYNVVTMSSQADWGEDVTIRQPSVIYDGVTFGLGVSTGHFVLIREGVEIGDDVSIGSYTEIGPHVRIGSGARIHSKCFISEYTQIGENAWLGPGVMVANVWHPLCSWAKECIRHYGLVIIGKSAIIGMGAIIGPGVTIGANAFVGAGALVLKDVACGDVVYGSPAHVRGRRSDLECTTDFLDGRPYGNLMGGQ